MKLWAGRFKQNTNQLVEAYNASIEFDQKLAEFDIQGSLAHVKMLGKCKIIEQDTVKSITQGLHQILKQLRNGELNFTVADEDIHMNIERMLHQLIGDEAGKLHTGRSRNDQVALDLHLYLRHHLVEIIRHEENQSDWKAGMSVRRDALMMTGGVTQVLYHSVCCLSGKGADPDPSRSIREKRKCFGGFSLLDRGYSDC